MFTGIIETVGQIREVAQHQQAVRLVIAADGMDLSDVAIGDSIAVSGVCLTVTALQAGAFAVDVSQATLDCTQGLQQRGNTVNLEKAMRLSDRLGGHLVSGHVDGVGEVARFEAVGDNFLLAVAAPQALSKYISCKGSITVDGVSLTVNAVSGDMFEINLIPHTLANTTLKNLQCGTKVNLEVDMLARYVERLLNGRRMGG